MHLVLFLMRLFALEISQNQPGESRLASGRFLFAPDNRPALQLRDRLALLDPHHVARLELVVLVVRVVVLGAADRLLVDRVGEAAIDAHHHRLGLLVAHDHALKGTFRHNKASYFFFARVCAAMVLMRAISRRASRSREVFSSCPVARWKRRLKRSFFRLRTASSLWSSLIARMSSTFIGAMTLLRNARDEARLDRQLGGGKRERLLGGLHSDAVDLENHAAGLDSRHP